MIYVTVPPAATARMVAVEFARFLGLEPPNRARSRRPRGRRRRELMRPRTLPIAAPPARHETVASYLARLAALHGLDGDELWKRITIPTPSPARRTVDIHQLSALTGRPPVHLTWRRLAAGDDEQLSRFTAAIGWRLCDPFYQPRGERDPIAHWIEQDCWRPPSPPPTMFAAAPGHRRPGHLNTTVTRANRERHDKAVLRFSRKRRPGQVILHHRTVHPVVIREWSIPMEQFAGASWQSQRTTDRFTAVP